MKTKIFCLTLVLVMIVSCFAGCSFFGGGGQGGGEGGGQGGEGGGQGGGNTGGFGDGEKTDDSWWDSISYETTDLIFMMTDCDNNEELPSGCGRYLAGREEDNEGQHIDELVAERNSKAYETANVNLTYRYYENNFTLYGFSKCYDVIFTEVSKQSSSSPDMYCNFMTDMLVTSLKGSFANLRSVKHGEGSYVAKNYFDLSDPGYMSDLMGSLTLSPEKVYVVASDYFLDLIRAFFIVPVNVSLYNQIAPDMIEDLNGDGQKNIDDIFKEVWAGDWTYDRLAEYSQKIFQEGSANKEGASMDDTLGFALGMNGLPAAGLVYTSEVVVIHKDPIEGTNKYEYYYEGENAQLEALANKVSALVNKTGVIVVDGTQAAEVEVTGNGAALLAIRKQFTSNKMLFGGIILVGSLEYESYQAMKNSGGFAIVPVPLYDKTYDAEGNQQMYLTQIHVVGRAGGISAKTTKFVQCSAFLQYQSSNSTEILNEYYDYNLTYDTASGVSGNVEMLKYIRANVRTSFDKLYEDAIGYLAPAGTELGVGTRWHNLIYKANYDLTNMREVYSTYYTPKQTSLQNLVTQYDSLPE